ncbi:hypothetical protein F2Q70_00019059 [Brassica cretica]|uniref:Uncharacterized protein n=1 Tax=Brassica cretica TaxID=69181 RepID=A0A8S9I4C8_BRACR|nr:hypothetical protein F2Q70_00019059 [Brassica cretica]
MAGASSLHQAADPLILELEPLDLDLLSIPSAKIKEIDFISAQYTTLSARAKGVPPPLPVDYVIPHVPAGSGQENPSVDASSHNPPNRDPQVKIPEESSLEKLPPIAKFKAFYLISGEKAPNWSFI